MHVCFISQRIISATHMSFTSSRLFAEVPSLSPVIVYSPIDRETYGGNFENDVSNLALIEQSADQNNVCALADCANFAIQFADINYDDNYEDGTSKSAKINQLTFQTNSEPLDESEPTDDSEVEEEE